MFRSLFFLFFILCFSGELFAQGSLFNKLYDYYDYYWNSHQEETPCPIQLDKKISRVTVMQANLKTIELSTNVKDNAKTLSPLLGQFVPSTGGPSLSLSESVGWSSMNGMNCGSFIARGDLNLLNDDSVGVTFKGGPTAQVNIDTNATKKALKTAASCLVGVQGQCDVGTLGGVKLECGVGYRKAYTGHPSPSGPFLYTAKTLTLPLGASVREETEYFFKKRELTTRQKENWGRRLDRISQMVRDDQSLF